MSTTIDEQALDRLAQAASLDRLPHGPALDEMVARAALVARNRRRRRVMTQQTWLAAAAVIVGVLAGTAVRWRSASPPEIARAFEFQLPSGDRVAATPDVAFAIRESSPTRRGFELERGRMLFDVMPLVAGQSFTVVAPGLRAEVQGTVFEVSADEGRSVVHVYEGRVHVMASGVDRTLAAGQTYGLSPTGNAAWTSPLGELAQAAVLRRSAERSRPRASEGPVAGPPANAAASETAASAPARAAAPSPRVVTDPLRDPSIREPGLQGPTTGVVWMAEADRRRLGGDHESAVAAYEHAADVLGPSPATQAGYAAALLLLDRLAQPERALAVLERTHADRPGSPVEERAFALRVRALLALHRQDQARSSARLYVARFPGGPAQAWMVELADSGQ